MEYMELQRVVQRTFVETLPVAGLEEAKEASRRMADYLGLPNDVGEAMADDAAAAWQEFRRRWVN